GASKIEVSRPAGEQPRGRRLMPLGPLALVIRLMRTADLRPLVPVDPQPAKPPEDRLQRFGDIPLSIGVIDAQHKTAAALPRQQPVEKRGANPADMQVAGRARGKTRANHGPTIQSRARTEAGTGAALK